METHHALLLSPTFTSFYPFNMNISLVFLKISNQSLTPLEKFVGPVPDPFLNWITELSNVSAEQRWILLENLKAATVYQFRVSAVNQVGEGSPSEPSNIVELPQEGKFVCFFSLSVLICKKKISVFQLLLK